MKTVTFLPNPTLDEVKSVLLPDYPVAKFVTSILAFVLGTAGIVFLFRLERDWKHPISTGVLVMLALGYLTWGVGASLQIRTWLRMHKTFARLLQEAGDRGPITISDAGLQHGAGPRVIEVPWWRIKEQKVTDKAVLIVTDRGERIILSTNQLVDLRVLADFVRLMSDKAPRPEPTDEL